MVLRKKFQLHEILVGAPFLSELADASKRAYFILQKAGVDEQHIFSAAETLDSNIHTHTARSIIILTGFPCSNYFETDGPIGAVFLGEFLARLHPNVKIFVERPLLVPLRKSLQDLNPKSTLKILSADSLTSFTDSVLISIEYPGANREGVQHNMTGKPIQIPLFPLEVILQKAPPLYWLAIGDGGNEIGLGKMREGIAQALPYTLKCQCHCASGIIADLAADAVILGLTSNYAAIGLLLLLAKRRSTAHSYSWEKFLLVLETLNFGGCLDGISGAVGSVDGIMAAGNLEKYYSTLRDFFDSSF